MKKHLKTRILIMRPNEPHETKEVVLEEEGSGSGFYHAIHDIVQPIVGDDIERVRVYADFENGTEYKYLDMFVDEMGNLRNPPPPRNESATILYRRNTILHDVRFNGNPESLVAIVGPAVLFEHPVWT